MVLSSATPSAEEEYVCDLCQGSSVDGHRDGSKQRWKCESCNYDVCFDCRSETLGPLPAKRRKREPFEYGKAIDPQSAPQGACSH